MATGTRVLWLAAVAACSGALVQPTALRHVIAASNARESSRGIGMMAKKGGKSKKGKQPKKQSGFAWAASFENPPDQNATLMELAELMTNSYRARTGKPLHRSLDGAENLPKALWKAPVAALVIMSEEGEEVAEEGAAGVVCRYANQAACEAFGFPAKDGYKSVIDQPTELAASSGADKYESGYSKKLTRSGATGEDAPSGFQLSDAQRWRLEKASVVEGKLVMQPVGYAYAWEEWIDEVDGYVCKPGGLRAKPEISAEDLATMIEDQGAEVRRLKEEDGMTNSDPAVKAAVAELLRLKALQEA